MNAYVLQSNTLQTLLQRKVEEEANLASENLMVDIGFQELAAVKHSLKVALRVYDALQNSRCFACQRMITAEERMSIGLGYYKYALCEKIHDTAQPTQALKMFEVYQNRATDLKEQQQKELMDKYGGQEHMEAPRELIFSQNENYVEYARDGRVLKGSERALTKSKYEEDVLIGNHTSTWGSWFDAATGRWGFACCHQTMKNAYCVPIKKGELEAPPGAEEGGIEPPEALADADANGEAEVGGSLPSSAPISKLNEMRSSAFGHVLEERAEGGWVEACGNMGDFGRLTLEDERNRGYGSLAGESLAGEISPEEYEAYRLTRQRADDPMAKFM
eukprot:s2395_g5.t1